MQVRRNPFAFCVEPSLLFGRKSQANWLDPSIRSPSTHACPKVWRRTGWSRTFEEEIFEETTIEETTTTKRHLCQCAIVPLCHCAIVPLCHSFLKKERSKQLKVHHLHPTIQWWNDGVSRPFPQCSTAVFEKLRLFWTFDVPRVSWRVRHCTELFGWPVCHWNEI